MSFTVEMSVKEMFFDRAAVVKKIGAENARRLSKAGAYIRRRARTAILRRRKGTSSPGSPPHVHSKSSVATLKNILFALNKDWESVIVGPVRLNQVEMTPNGKTTVPERLEKGGTGLLSQQRSIGSNRWYRRDNRVSKKKNIEYRTIRAQYAARPFMGPALEAEVHAGTIGSLWAKSA